VLDQLQTIDESDTCAETKSDTAANLDGRRKNTRSISACLPERTADKTSGRSGEELVSAAIAFVDGTDLLYDEWSEIELAECLQKHRNFSEVDITQPTIGEWSTLFCSVEMSLLCSNTEISRLQHMESWLTSAVLVKEVEPRAQALLASLAFVGRKPNRVLDHYQLACRSVAGPTAGAGGDNGCHPANAAKPMYTVPPFTVQPFTVPRGLPAVHYALSLIQMASAKATDKNTAAAQMESLIGPLNTLADQYQAQHRSDTFMPVLRVLTDFARVAAGQREVGETIWLGGLHIDASPWLDLFINLCGHWLDTLPDEQLVQRLVRHIDRASEIGLHWYVDEGLTLLSILGLRRETTDFQPQIRTSGWLHSIYQQQSDWQAELNALSLTVNRYVRLTEPKGDQVRNRRMSWWLQADGTRLRVEPREQRLGKNDRWSRGRRFPLKLLLDDCGTMDFLCEQDLKICADLRNQLQINHALHFEKSFEIRAVSSLQVIFEHPRLYRINDETESTVCSVTTKECGPTLHIVNDSALDTINISMRPFPGDALASADAFFCYWENVSAQESEKASDRIAGQGVDQVGRDSSTLVINRFTEGQLEIARALSHKGLTVPVEGSEAVLESLRSMASLIEVHSDIAVSDSQSVPPDTKVYVHVCPLQQGLDLKLFQYPLGTEGPCVKPGKGKVSLHALIKSSVVNTTRNFETEVQESKAITQDTGLALAELTDAWHWSLTDPEQSLEVLASLQDMGNRIALLWPADEKIVLSSRFECDDMQLQISSGRKGIGVSGELMLDKNEGGRGGHAAIDLSGTDAFDSISIDLQKLLQSLNQTDGRFLTLDDGKILQLSRRLRQQLDALNAVCNNGIAHPLSVAVLEEATRGMVLQDDESWNEQLDKLREAEALMPQPPSTLKADLRDYQLNGYQWMARLAHWGAGACLADDMGLGKTMQSLALILTRASGGPTLVVAPTSVCGNWLAEAERFAPSLRIRWMGGSKRTRMLRNAKAGDLFICSYGVLQNDIETIREIDWQTIVADEAQSFKNAGTRRSQAMMSLKANFRMIASGTPIENHLGELWNLFRFINPGLLGSSKQFRERYAVPIEQQNDEQARDRLKYLIRPFILRRMKREVLTELPERTEITHLVEFNEGERAFYDGLREQALQRISEYAELDSEQRFRVLAEITTLRQASCHPALVTEKPPCDSAKMRAFAEIVDELRRNGHRCLVFSQFVGHLTLIRKHLDSQRISYQYLDGSTTVKKRKQAVDDFQAGQGELFLISLKAGGSGLNLTAADYVIHMDPWWNPAVEDQASDRAYRMGQKRPVTIYRMVVKDTIEEKIVKLHEQKRELANALLEGTDSGSRLSVEELVELIEDEEVESGEV